MELKGGEAKSRRAGRIWEEPWHRLLRCLVVTYLQDNLSLWNTRISKSTIITSNQFCWLIRESQHVHTLRPAMGKPVLKLQSLREMLTYPWLNIYFSAPTIMKQYQIYDFFFRDPGHMFGGVLRETQKSLSVISFSRLHLALLWKVWNWRPR